MGIHTSYTSALEELIIHDKDSINTSPLFLKIINKIKNKLNSYDFFNEKLIKT